LFALYCFKKYENLGIPYCEIGKYFGFLKLFVCSRNFKICFAVNLRVKGTLVLSPFSVVLLPFQDLSGLYTNQLHYSRMQSKMQL